MVLSVRQGNQAKHERMSAIAVARLIIASVCQLKTNAGGYLLQDLSYHATIFKF